MRNIIIIATAALMAMMPGVPSATGLTSSSTAATTVAPTHLDEIDYGWEKSINVCILYPFLYLDNENITMAQAQDILGRVYDVECSDKYHLIATPRSYIPYGPFKTQLIKQYGNFEMKGFFSGDKIGSVSYSFYTPDSKTAKKLFSNIKKQLLKWQKNESEPDDFYSIDTPDGKMSVEIGDGSFSGTSISNCVTFTVFY